jgi:hypothetical protein
MGQGRLTAKDAITIALQYFWRDPTKLNSAERLAMTLMAEISRLEEGIVEALEESPIDREQLVALLYRNRDRDK